MSIHILSFKHKMYIDWLLSSKIFHLRLTCIFLVFNKQRSKIDLKISSLIQIWIYCWLSASAIETENSKNRQNKKKMHFYFWFHLLTLTCAFSIAQIFMAILKIPFQQYYENKFIFINFLFTFYSSIYH